MAGGGIRRCRPGRAHELIGDPEQTPRGETIAVDITIAESSGTPVPAVIQLRVDITDPVGRPAEWSGFYGAANGRLNLKLDIADNDATGVWHQVGL